MITIHRMALATPATMGADAYREFCWGAGLERTAAGYGLLLAFDDDTWEEVMAVVEDVEYVRQPILPGSLRTLSCCRRRRGPGECGRRPRRSRTTTVASFCMTRTLVKRRSRRPG
ncbi:hypothetical protein ACF090_36530 [Streptomyces sp. NPDC014892]|uniref:hypothetical protein n=1 Tax=Streptomyces sp. NPDC014892 TaxID=3364930 RepID=UPI0036FEC3CD